MSFDLDFNFENDPGCYSYVSLYKEDERYDSTDGKYGVES